MTTRNKPDPLQGKSFREFFDLPAHSEGPLESRRRFVKAGVAAAPVVMTVASRPVWGSNCSLSGDIMSGNLSNQDHSCTVGFGCTPGGYKESPDRWVGTGYSPGTCKEWNNENQTKCRVWNPNGTAFNDSSAFGCGSSKSMMVILQEHHEKIITPLEFHAVAALLNAAHGWYGATVEEVRAAYCMALEGTEEQKGKLHEVFEYMNQDRGECPMNAHGYIEDCDPLVLAGFYVIVDGSCVPVDMSGS